MTDWKTLLIPVILIVALGVILNLIVSPFVETNIINPDSFLYGSSFVDTYFINPQFISSTDTNISFLGFDISIPFINPIGILPEVMEDFFLEQIIIMSYIPNAIIIPFFVITLISFIWAFIKLMPFT